MVSHFLTVLLMCYNFGKFTRNKITEKFSTGGGCSGGVGEQPGRKNTHQVHPAGEPPVRLTLRFFADLLT